MEVRPRCVLTYFLATLGSLCPCHAKPAHGHGQDTRLAWGKVVKNILILHSILPGNQKNERKETDFDDEDEKDESRPKYNIIVMILFLP